jgi:hypothetical protein
VSWLQRLRDDGDLIAPFRGWPTGAWLLLSLLFVYLLLMGSPLVRGLPDILAAVLLTVLFTAAALTAALQVSRLQIGPLAELAGLLLGVLNWFLYLSIGISTDIGRLTIVPASDVLLLLGLMMGGRLFVRIARDVKLMLPIALTLILMDIGTVYFGFTGAMLENAPGIVEAVSVKLPEVGSAAGPEGISGLRHMATMGPGDTLFAAFFFAGAVRFGLNLRRSFRWILGIIAVTLALLVAIPSVPPIPLLPLMTVGFLVPNWRSIKLDREEWGYLAIAFVFLMLIIGAMSYLTRMLF